MPAISRGDGSLMVFQICLELFSNLELQRLQLKWPGADLIVSLAVSQGGHRSFGGAACSKWVIWREEKQFGQDVAKGVSLPGLLSAWTQVFWSFWGSFLLMWWLLNQTSPLLHGGLTTLWWILVAHLELWLQEHYPQSFFFCITHRKVQEEGRIFYGLSGLLIL